MLHTRRDLDIVGHGVERLKQRESASEVEANMAGRKVMSAEARAKSCRLIDPVAMAVVDRVRFAVSGAEGEISNALAAGKADLQPVALGRKRQRQFKRFAV